MKLNYFKEINFLPAIKALLKELNVPINCISDEPTTAKEILDFTYKDNETFQLIGDVYFVGMVDDAAFEGNDSFDHRKIKSDYDGILFFGVELNKRENNLLPTRTQLADIARAFNREFHFTPVVVVFKYSNEDESFISFANTERIKYKQEWREGEKAGKVSLLRDISIEKPHRGHEDIINALRITTTGKKAIRTFDALYKYWQEVFSVNILNKKFYQELSNWYFWAIKNVTFPSEPTLEDVIKKYGKADHDKLSELINEHNATNVIRLLTRLLFTWFIKEKKLIPESLFDLDALQDDILKDINPYQQEGMFKHASTDSIYYKAILQNLFFASLNCPIEADSVDKRKRGFRGDGYGTHRGIDYLMRYKKEFKDPDAFLDLMNQTVPFLNGGLFECLDDKYQNIYIDGFSDQMTKSEKLIVPDYLFFGLDTEVDLSQDYGSNNKKHKKAAVKGLINILKSYKFTITENTPIEEEVALDPELLGKVFENLLASYNPETKSTARKQTGSFYTPREIVNYMVNESLIAYLKNAIDDWGIDEEELDKKLHELTSFDPVNPFEDNTQLSRLIIKNLDKCKILDPACGSGAFPMGILQKMVHILQKLDPTNEHWKEVQLEKAIQASKKAYDIEDKQERENKLIEINNAFDSNINDPDYARKLYLIENCIYGVDIQPIATQISKLRFFISLVVDQKKNDSAENFGIRALPNLESKFVTANTLIGIEKPSAQASLYDTESIKELEKELKAIRHKLFGARTKDTKLKYRKKDEELRNAISEELKKSGWHNETADKLASWDPYDQNASASYFDSEWMFDVKEGFDVVIGNPPYLRVQGIRESNTQFADWLSKHYFSATGSYDLYAIFTEKGVQLSNKTGLVCYIMPVKWTNAAFGKGLRGFLLKEKALSRIISFDEYQVFNASTYTGIQFFEKKSQTLSYNQLNTDLYTGKALNNYLSALSASEFNIYSLNNLKISGFTLTDQSTGFILDKLRCNKRTLNDVFEKIYQGIATSKDSVFFLTNCDIHDDYVTGYSKEIGESVKIEKAITKPLLKGDQVHKYDKLHTNNIVIFPYQIRENKSELMSEMYIKSNFPQAYNYLKRNETVLKNREKGRLINDPYWFRYIYPKNQTLFEKQKLVAPDVSMGGNFTYDQERKYYFTTTVYGYIKKSTIVESYWYWIGILNSSVIWWYLKNTGSVMANGYFRFKPDYLKPFPIPDMATESVDYLSQILMEIGSKHASFNVINQIQNSLIFNLYFLDHMKEKEIDIVEHVERDIQEVMKGKDFKDLSIVEKETVINQLYDTWTHPDNEVRNRMKLFAVRSPEILKPILES